MLLSSIINSWFPIARSADIKKGSNIALQILGHQLVLFRSHRNEVGLLKRQCPHMGGDLSRGRVTGSGVVCPIHHWEFAPDGSRLKTGGSGCTQGSTCQASIQCTERWGLIFGYFGDRPGFKLPETQSDVFYSRPAVRDIDMNYTVPSLFGFDTEHFSTVHHRELTGLTIYRNAPEHIGTELKFQVGTKRWSDRVLQRLGLNEIETDVDYWGGNIVFGRHRKTQTYALITTLPLDEHTSRIYVVTMQEKPAGNRLRVLLSWCKFHLFRQLTYAFIQQDEHALTGVRFDAGKSKQRPDNMIHQWLEHVEQLPSTRTRELLD